MYSKQARLYKVLSNKVYAFCSFENSSVIVKTRLSVYKASRPASRFLFPPSLLHHHLPFTPKLPTTASLTVIPKQPTSNVKMVAQNSDYGVSETSNHHNDERVEATSDVHDAFAGVGGQFEASNGFTAPRANVELPDHGSYSPETPTGYQHSPEYQHPESVSRERSWSGSTLVSRNVHAPGAPRAPRALSPSFVAPDDEIMYQEMNRWIHDQDEVGFHSVL